MKICLLAAACCIHTIRWANGLAKFGQEVVLLSQHPLKESLDKSVTFHFLPYVGGLGYILNSRVVRKHLHAVKPDILNVHFASGYGLLANLAGFSPMLLSVLGSDVYDFPKRSFFHKLLLRWNLRKADAIASTSNCMAAQTRRIHNHSHVFITPFGVEVDKEEKPLFTILGAVDGVIFYMDSNKVAIYEYSTEKALDDEKTNDEMLNDWLSNGKFLLETNNQEAKDIFSSVN